MSYQHVFFYSFYSINSLSIIKKLLANQIPSLLNIEMIFFLRIRLRSGHLKRSYSIIIKMYSVWKSCYIVSMWSYHLIGCSIASPRTWVGLTRFVGFFSPWTFDLLFSNHRAIDLTYCLSCCLFLWESTSTCISKFQNYYGCI